MPVDMTVNSFFWSWVTERNCFQIKNTNRPHGSGEEQDSKLGNSLTLAFLVSKRVITEARPHSARSDTDDYV